MSSLLTIKISNKSIMANNFYIFADKPQIDGTTGNVFQPYFMKGGVPADGQIEFVFQNDLYAAVGNAVVSPGSKIAQSHFSPHPVTLGTMESGAVVPGSYYPVTVTDGLISLGTEEKRSPLGSYTLKTKPDFEIGSNYFVGLGRKDNSGTIVTVAVRAATPNATIDIIPNVTFFITTASYDAGKLFDIRVGGAIQEIDFAGGKSKATVEYTPTGEYVIQVD